MTFENQNELWQENGKIMVTPQVLTSLSSYNIDRIIIIIAMPAC